MLQSGIFTGYFPYGLAETAKRIRNLGFNTVQLDLHFKDIDLSAGQITAAKAKTVSDTFRAQNLPICCVSDLLTSLKRCNSALYDPRRISAELSNSRIVDCA